MGIYFHRQGGVRCLARRNAAVKCRRPPFPGAAGSPTLTLRTFQSMALRSLAFLLAGAAAWGAPGPSDYFYRTWRIDNGLIDNSVNTVLQDPSGYLWLATLTGLARFDGRSFKAFPLPGPHAESENIRSLAQEDPTTLVMLPASGGIVRLRDGRFSRHPADAAVRDRHLLKIFAEPDGALWLGEFAGDVLRWQDGRLRTFGPGDGLGRSLAGLSVAADSRGRTWVAEGDFLGWMEQGRLVRFPSPVGTELVIAPARSGGIWIAGAERLLREDDGRLSVQVEGPAWNGARDEVRNLFEDREGALWIATQRNGLFQFAAGVLRAVPTQQQILSSVTEDSEEGIWVASKGGGITRLQHQRFVLLRPGSDQADIASTGVCADSSGALWCANRDGGVFRYSGGVIQHVANPPGEPPLYANTLCPGAGGVIWVGAKSGLYRVPAGGAPALEPVAPDLKDIHLLYWSRQGDLWVTVGRTRLLRLHGGVWEDMLPGRPADQKPVEAMAETSDGTLWVALGDELYACRAGALVRDHRYDAFAGQYISALYGDPRGALWLGTDRGLLRLLGQRLAPLTQAQGLPADRIRQILEDGHGNFWLGTLRNYLHVARTDLEAVAEGRASRVAVVTFGPEEGLTGQTPLYNCQPNAWRGGDRLWFCTQDGVLGIDANSAPLRLPVPPVSIDRVRIDGREANPLGLRLTTGQRRIAFGLSSPNFAAPEKVRLRYRLAGFDPAWNETVAGQDATYAGLPAGRYVLEVAASDPTGNYHEGIGAGLPFVVVPLWWETWWARLLALAAFTAGIVWLARFTSHRLLRRHLARIEQEHALEQERARIARDLHDELGSSLTRIALRADRLKRRSEKSEFGPGLSQLARQARRLTGELESIIWTVNPRNNSLDRFASFVRQFALRFFQETEIQCSVRGGAAIPAWTIAPEVQHHLLSATKEALTNVLKHSQAGAVTLELDCAGGRFTTRIRDNGIGFKVGAAEHSERNGLANIASRLREIGGALEIRSSADGGTEISWSVPVAAPAELAASPAAPPSPL